MNLPCHSVVIIIMIVKETRWPGGFIKIFRRLMRHGSCGFPAPSIVQTLPVEPPRRSQSIRQRNVLQLAVDLLGMSYETKPVEQPTDQLPEMQNILALTESLVAPLIAKTRAQFEHLLTLEIAELATREDGSRASPLRCAVAVTVSGGRLNFAHGKLSPEQSRYRIKSGLLDIRGDNATLMCISTSPKRMRNKDWPLASTIRTFDIETSQTTF